MATSLLRKGDARALIRYLQQTGIPFQLVRSNYTLQIKSELINEKYVNIMQSNQTFAAFAKIKSDVKDKPKPNVRKDDLIYYSHNFKASSFTPSVTNIDLTCAYATVLYNEKILTQDTMKYLLRLPKQSRLVSIGMLAARKKIFDYDQYGIIAGYDEVISENSPFFYLAIKRTYEIMTDLKIICGDNYLFTWVDGIYYKPDPNIDEACSLYLKNACFGYTIEDLQNFTVKYLSRKIILTFKKWDKKAQDWKVKSFNLPHKETVVERIALDIIKSPKIKHNETGKTKVSKKGS